MKELEEMEKYQATANNGMDVQENLDRLRLEVKNAEKEVEKCVCLCAYLSFWSLRPKLSFGLPCIVLIFLMVC